MRAHLSYANVVATVALFIALGGTSYAVATLPRNSVGARQLRTDSVGRSEIRKSAVRSTEIRNRSVALQDISLSARTSLRGRQGPAGPPGASVASFSAAVDAGGGVRSGSGGRLEGHSNGTGVYAIRFGPDLRSCYAVASLSTVSGSTPVTPENGEVVTTTTDFGVEVRTRNSSGAPADLPFHVIVVC